MRAFSDGSTLADPADKLLPGAPGARQAVDRFRRALEDARAVGEVAIRKEQDALGVKGRAAGRVQDLTRGTWNLPPTHPSVVMALRDLDAASEELAKAQARSAEAREARRDLAQFCGRMEQWLRSLPAGSKVKDLKPAAPALLKSELARDAVLRLRDEIARAFAKRREIEAAPITSAEARAVLRKNLEELIARGAPSVDAIVEGAAESIAWPVSQRSVLVGTAVVDGRLVPVTRENAAPEVDMLALVAWLNKDLLLKRLDDQLAEASDDGRALSREQRAKKLAQLDGAILELERQEAAMVTDAGLPPRGDMDVRAAIGCDGPAMESN